MDKKSKFFSLSFQDFIKGSIVAILSGVLTFLTGIANIESHVSIKQIIIAAVIGLLSYLIKNLFTNSNDKLLTKE